MEYIHDALPLLPQEDIKIQVHSHFLLRLYLHKYMNGITHLCPWSCLLHQAQARVPLGDHMTPRVSEVKQSLLPSAHHPGHPGP